MWDDNTVIYCRKGHRVGWIPEHYFRSFTPGRLRDAIMQHQIEELIRLGYCTQCGAESVPACESCQAVLGNPSKRPAYCGSCGKPFPWTATALVAAEEYTDELDTLTAEDKTALKESFADLTVDTARTPLAVSRYKRIVRKLAPVAAETLQKIIVEVITNSAKNLMGVP